MEEAGIQGLYEKEGEMKVAKVLVTGGCGFIGSHLTRRLVRDGHEVSVLDNMSSGKVSNIADVLNSVELYEGDIMDLCLLTECMDGVDYVFHHAAKVSVQESIACPIWTEDTNVAGTVGVLTTARSQRVRRVIFASSSAVYGNNPCSPKTEDMLPAPASPYAASKLAGEAYLKAFCGAYGMDSVALRYFNVYGPGQNADSGYAAVIPGFISKVLRGESPAIFGDGKQTRDFVHVDDVVQANILAMGISWLGGEAINVGSGRSVSVNELHSLVHKLAGAYEKCTCKDARSGDIRHSVADISKAGKLLGYSPAVRFEDGLRATFECYKRCGLDKPGGAGGALA